MQAAGNGPGSNALKIDFPGEKAFSLKKSIFRAILYKYITAAGPVNVPGCPNMLEAGTNMRCEELLKGLSYECIRGNTECEIKEVVYDSRKLSEGCLFICISGYKVDGHSFAGEAASSGAAAIVVEKDVLLPEGSGAAVIRVDRKSTRLNSSHMA